MSDDSDNEEERLARIAQEKLEADMKRKEAEAKFRAGFDNPLAKKQAEAKKQKEEAVKASQNKSGTFLRQAMREPRPAQ